MKAASAKAASAKAARCEGAGAAAADFGWSLGGQAVALLSERTLQLELEPLHDGIPCYQCGICTAACALAESSRRFPRRSIALIQLGLDGPTCHGTEPWECHACGDCTEHCPNRLGPARQLADLRQRAVEAAVRPRWLAEYLDHWRGLAAVASAAMLGVVALAAISGSLVVAGPVHYASFLPHPALILSFTGLVVASLVVLGRAAARAWQWYLPGSLSRGTMLRAIARVSWEALLHRKQAACPDGSARARAHAAVFASFLGLTLLAGWAAGTLALGGQYPFPLDHPAKIVGNALALLMVAGSGWMLFQRFLRRASDRPGRPFDVFLPLSILLIALTGIALEVCRVLDVRFWAYPLYVGHLGLVAVLLGLLPWTKLAHAVHRLVALTSRSIAASPAATRARQRRRQPRTSPRRWRAGEFPPYDPAPARFGMGKLTAEIRHEAQ